MASHEEPLQVAYLEIRGWIIMQTQTQGNWSNCPGDMPSWLDPIIAWHTGFAQTRLGPPFCEIVQAYLNPSTGLQKYFYRFMRNVSSLPNPLPLATQALHIVICHYRELLLILPDGYMQVLWVFTCYYKFSCKLCDEPQGFFFHHCIVTLWKWLERNSRT